MCNLVVKFGKFYSIIYKDYKPTLTLINLTFLPFAMSVITNQINITHFI